MFFLSSAKDLVHFMIGEYWVVGVDIEQYDEKRPDKYLRGLFQKEMDLSIVNAYRSYFSIVASAPINFMNFTRLVNKYRQKPPFNFTNPLAKVGGVVQVTIRDEIRLRKHVKKFTPCVNLKIQSYKTRIFFLSKFLFFLSFKIYSLFFNNTYN